MKVKTDLFGISKELNTGAKEVLDGEQEKSKVSNLAKV